MSGDPVYRVSGVGQGSGDPKGEKRTRKEATQLELRQYRQELLEARGTEHKSWFDNDVTTW